MSLTINRFTLDDKTVEYPSSSFPALRSGPGTKEIETKKGRMNVEFRRQIGRNKSQTSNKGSKSVDFNETAENWRGIFLPIAQSQFDQYVQSLTILQWKFCHQIKNVGCVFVNNLKIGLFLTLNFSGKLYSLSPSPWSVPVLIRLGVP